MLHLLSFPATRHLPFVFLNRQAGTFDAQEKREKQTKIEQSVAR